MATVAVHVSTTQGHGGFPPTTSVGGDSFLSIDGHAVLLVGSQFNTHSDGDSSHNATVSSGSDFLTINGIAAALVGSSLSDGDIIASTESSFLTVES